MAWENSICRRRGNANPITYQGKSGKQFVAITATDTIMVFALAQK